MASPNSPNGPAGAPPTGPERFLDVYIIGGESADPNAQLKLAALIAGRYRVAAPAVADGLSGGFCLVGKRLPEVDARRLADELRDLGATPKLQPAGIPLRITIKRSPDGRARSGGTGAGGDSSAISGGFDRPATEAGPMQLVEMGARLETSVRQAPRPAIKKTSDMIRCPLHGLTYDRSLASGCLRCMQPAREVARAMESRTAGGLNTDPVKKAFVGLAVAVVVGLVPAAYYAVGINGAEVKRLRARQAELSDQPGTKEITDEFDALDAGVSQARGRGLRNTLVLWVLVSGAAGFAWLKLATPREREG